VSSAPSGDEGPTSYIEIEKTRNKLSETKDNNKKTNEQTNKKQKKKHKKKKKKKKKNQTTTQEHNLTAAARDLGTEPSGQLMFDGPQLCPIYGPRPVLLYLSTSGLVLGLSTLRTASPF
jgi:hypothetical protein